MGHMGSPNLESGVRGVHVEFVGREELGEAGICQIRLKLTPSLALECLFH